MNDKDQDPQLQAPQEANTTKHINFRELEEEDTGTTQTDDSADSDSPTKKAWEELRRDNSKKNADKDEVE